MSNLQTTDNYQELRWAYESIWGSEFTESPLKDTQLTRSCSYKKIKTFSHTCLSLSPTRPTIQLTAQNTSKWRATLTWRDSLESILPKVVLFVSTTLKITSTTIHGRPFISLSSQFRGSHASPEQGVYFYLIAILQ